MSNDRPEHPEKQPVAQLGDVLVPTFRIPNPMQQECQYTVTNQAQRWQAEIMLRSGRWVIRERRSLE